jgi:Domain of unknown function (DUF1848)
VTLRSSIFAIVILMRATLDVYRKLFGAGVRVRKRAGGVDVSDVYIIASTNTDIPTYYSRWLSQRISDGYVDLPLYSEPTNTVRVSLLDADVRGWIFYSKNYHPFLGMCRRLAGQPVTAFFTIGDDPVFRSKVPRLERLLDQVTSLRRSLGDDSVVWKLPPAFFSHDGNIRYSERILEVARTLARAGVTRCMVELFSPKFHSAEILDRLRSNGIDGGLPDNDPKVWPAVSSLINELQDIGLSVISGQDILMGNLRVDDIENRVNAFDIGRMGMPCPTGCLYCDTNLTLHLDREGSPRTSLPLDETSLSFGLGAYFRSLGLDTPGPPDEAVHSPYEVELRARIHLPPDSSPDADLTNHGRSVLLDVIGGRSDGHAYLESEVTGSKRSGD